MPKMTRCMLDAEKMSVKEALILRDDEKKNNQPRPDFRCDECGEQVFPHKEGKDGKGAAHFEHRHRNPRCFQSDPNRK